MSEDLKMNLITAPDILANENTSILLVNPSQADKEQFNDVAKNFTKSLNLYLFEEGQEADIPWLIQVAGTVNYIILNIDNSKQIEWLIGWLLNFSKTFYLTTNDHMPYNKINTRKVYDIQQVAEGVNYFEEPET